MCPRQFRVEIPTREIPEDLTNIIRDWFAQARCEIRYHYFEQKNTRFVFCEPCMRESEHPTTEFFHVQSHQILIGSNYGEYNCSNCDDLIVESREIRQCSLCKEAILIFLSYLEQNLDEQPYLENEPTIIIIDHQRSSVK
ncbi:hypothetical protein PUN28_008766 [Cardiocondyla obscurior]|uniref:Uncharacterized protein n=1 Tax=Cardiocondyla obscurior TaxID=286306 RepID=A0AAW2E945_9HYME